MNKGIDLSLVSEGCEEILFALSRQESNFLSNGELFGLIYTTYKAKDVIEAYCKDKNNPNYQEAKSKLEQVLKRCYVEAKRRYNSFE